MGRLGGWLGAPWVIRIIEGQTEGTKEAAKISMEYWLVPKTNFSGREMPAEMVENLVDPEELKKQMDRGAETWDLTHAFVVDLVCPRNLLGQNVRKIEFFASSFKKTSLTGKDRLRIADGTAENEGQAKSRKLAAILRMANFVK